MIIRNYFQLEFLSKCITVFVQTREEIAKSRAAVFEAKKKENQNRGISKESQIGKKLK